MLVGDALGRAMVELLDAAAPETPYQNWAGSTSFAGTLTDPDPALDFDGGSLATGIEWVLGGDPTDPGDDAGLAPTLDNTSDPDGKLLFIFRRSAAANDDPNTTIVVEFGSDLDGWTTAEHQGAGPDDITITALPDPSDPGIDIVTVALPPNRAAAGKLFARLRVTIEP